MKNIVSWYKGLISTTIDKVYTKIILKQEFPNQRPLTGLFKNNNKEILPITKSVTSLMVDTTQWKTHQNWGCIHICKRYHCIVNDWHLDRCYLIAKKNPNKYLINLMNFGLQDMSKPLLSQDRFNFEQLHAEIEQLVTSEQWLVQRPEKQKNLKAVKTRENSKDETAMEVYWGENNQWRKNNYI